jgi:hypothetical protein
MLHFFAMDACSTAIICPFIWNSSAAVCLSPPDEECRRPEDDDRCGRGDPVLGVLTVLRTRQRRRPGRYSLSLERELLAGVGLIDRLVKRRPAQYPTLTTRSAPSAAIPRLRMT